jgi:hypothetical protein
MGGWAWMGLDVPFEEHPGYLIYHRYQKIVKNKIYSPRSVSLLGFVASYMKRDVK